VASEQRRTAFGRSAHYPSDSFANSTGKSTAVVKGFRTPDSHWREGMHGGRRPKSLEGGPREFAPPFAQQLEKLG
jgi:hypothetical protein